MGTDGNQEDVKFTDEQQAFINKAIGAARVKAREKAEQDATQKAKSAADAAEQSKLEASKEWEKLASKHAARVQELEGYETEATAYREMVAEMLKNRVKALGDTAKKAVGALPESLTTVEKLNWLNQNEELFKEKEVVGTPRRKKSGGKQGDADKPITRIPLRL